MKIVTISSERNRDTRRTADHLHRLGIPYATAPIPTTVQVARGDHTTDWDGYRPDLIRKHCPLTPGKD